METQQIEAGQSLKVSPDWLATCGMSYLADTPLYVVRADDHGRRGVMYHVELPNGRGWVVWSIRGVTRAE